jgi:DNA polymerase I-like protein with 3'-5' exonuclease and polymerase domains
VAKKWMDLLDQELNQHNTSPPSSELLDSSENGTDKIDKNTEKPKKKKKLTPEEGYEKTLELADEWSCYVISNERALACLEWARETDAAEIDIETYGRIKRDGLLYTRCQIRLIILHHEEHMWLIDCHHVPDETVAEILGALRYARKIFHNALFDVPRLYRTYGVLLDENVDDTMIASRVARAGEWERKKGRAVQKSHSLGDCIKRELDVEIPKDTRLKWNGLLTDEHLTYAGDDVYHLQDLHLALEDVLDENGVLGRYEAIRDRLPDFIGAAVRGVPLDAERLQPILDTYTKEVDDLRARLDKLAPEHPEGGVWIWGNTSKETTPEGKGRNGVLRALKELGLEFSDLQDQTLLDHRDDHEIVGVLYHYRKKANTIARYRKWIPDFYDAQTGRLYPQPKVAAAVTGRVLYSDPNAQGIDKKKTKEFREVVRAKEGRAIVKGDFAQQELRIAAFFSEDRAMLNAFAKGRDIYQEVATALVGHEVSKDDPARDAAKRATLGFLYGLGVDKYRTNVYKDTGESLPGEQAVKDRQAFRAAFPTFYNW